MESLGSFSVCLGSLFDPCFPFGVFWGSSWDSFGSVCSVSVVCWLAVSVDSRGSVSRRLGLLSVWLCEWLGKVVLLLCFEGIVGLVEGRPLLCGGFGP